MPQVATEAPQQYSLAIDGRPNEDAPKVNWNHLRCTFRPRSGRLQQQQLDPTELCWGGSSGGGGSGSGGSSGKGAGSGHAPAALAARPKSAGFPARFHRRARRRGASVEEAAAAAAAAAAEEYDELAEMWRLDDEDTVELDDIFDQLTKRGVDEKQRRKQQQQQQKKQRQLQQQQQQQQQRPWRPNTAVRSRKSATQLYQEHLLAEVAKHRLKAASGQRPPPPELALFIPKTRTRLCRLYTGPCLLRSSTGSSAAASTTASSSAGGGFMPIARPLAPLPAELRPLSRQSWTGNSRGGIAQVSGDACNCRAASAAATTAGVGRRFVASNYGDNCAVCQRLRMLQLA